MEVQIEAISRTLRRLKSLGDLGAGTLPGTLLSRRWRGLDGSPCLRPPPPKRFGELMRKGLWQGCPLLASGSELSGWKVATRMAFDRLGLFGGIIFEGERNVAMLLIIFWPGNLI